MKFKAGDRVKVREDLEVGNYYNGIYFASRMKKYKGQIINIEGITCDDDIKVYRYDGWSFVDEMLEPVKEDKKMKFKVGDIVYHRLFNLKGEVLYISSNSHTPYLVGFKGFDGHTAPSLGKDMELEIERKGYKDQCKWCKEENLEPVKEEKKMRNLDVIANDKRLNDIGVCKACYKLKNNMSCTGVSCQECEFLRLKDCYKFLAEEYKPKIKLTKFEYDLLVAYNFRENYCTFGYFDPLKAMKEKGYFKNVTDTSMKIKDILDNCEIEEE